MIFKNTNFLAASSISLHFAGVVVNAECASSVVVVAANAVSRCRLAALAVERKRVGCFLDAPVANTAAGHEQRRVEL